MNSSTVNEILTSHVPAANKSSEKHKSPDKQKVVPIEAITTATHVSAEITKTLTGVPWPDKLERPKDTFLYCSDTAVNTGNKSLTIGSDNDYALSYLTVLAWKQTS